MTGDEIDDLAQRLARAVVCAIVGALAGAVACAAAGMSYGWNRPARRHWVPFDSDDDLVTVVPFDEVLYRVPRGVERN